MAHSPCEPSLLHNILQTNGCSKDQYKEFLWVSRVWSHVTSVRRQGQVAVHHIDSLLSHRHSNSLAIYCPAYPEVGFNVFWEFLASLAPKQRSALIVYCSPQKLICLCIGTWWQSSCVAMAISSWCTRRMESLTQTMLLLLMVTPIFLTWSVSKHTWR